MQAGSDSKMSSEAKTMHKLRLNLRLHSSQIPKFFSQKGHLQGVSKAPKLVRKACRIQRIRADLDQNIVSILYVFQEIYPNIREISWQYTSRPRHEDLVLRLHRSVMNNLQQVLL